MPPHRPKHHHDPQHHHEPRHHHDLVSPTVIRSFLTPARIEPMLAAFVPDPEDRAFVARCILEQGPIHHRGANFALLSILAVLLERTGGIPDKPHAGKTVAVPLRIPPHLAPKDDEDRVYPLHMPLAPLEVVAPKNTPAFEALVDCLLDGPPHHALANAALVSALGTLLDRFSAQSGDKP